MSAAVSPNAIGFFLELHDSLTPSLKKTGVSYKTALKDIQSSNVAFQKALHSGLNNISKHAKSVAESISSVATAFSTLPTAYRQAISAIQKDITPIKQPIEFTLQGGGRGGAGGGADLLAKTFSNILSNATMRLSPAGAGDGTKLSKNFDNTNLRGRYRKMTRPPDFIGTFKVPKFAKDGPVDLSYGGMTYDSPKGGSRPFGDYDLVLAKNHQEQVNKNTDIGSLIDSVKRLTEFTVSQAAKEGMRGKSLASLADRLTQVFQDRPEFTRAAHRQMEAYGAAADIEGTSSRREIRNVETALMESQKALIAQLAKLPPVAQKDLVPLMKQLNEENDKALTTMRAAGRERRSSGGGGRATMWPRPGGAGHEEGGDDLLGRVSRGRNRSGYWPWDPTKRIAMSMYLENGLRAAQSLGGPGMHTAEGFAEQYAQQYGFSPQAGRGLSLVHLLRAQSNGAPLTAQQVVSGLDAASSLGLSRSDLQSRELNTVFTNAQAGGADPGALVGMFTQMRKRGGMSGVQSAANVNYFRTLSQRTGLRTGMMAQAAETYMPQAMLSASASRMGGDQAAGYTRGLMQAHATMTKAFGGDAAASSMAASVTNLIAQYTTDPSAARQLMALGATRADLDNFTSTGNSSTLVRNMQRSAQEKFGHLTARQIPVLAQKLGIDAQALTHFIHAKSIGTVDVPVMRNIRDIERSAGSMAGQVSPMARSLTSGMDSFGQGINYMTGGMLSPEMIGGVNAIGTTADIFAAVGAGTLLSKVPGASWLGGQISSRAGSAWNAGRGFAGRAMQTARGWMGASRGSSMLYGPVRPRVMWGADRSMRVGDRMAGWAAKYANRIPGAVGRRVAPALLSTALRFGGMGAGAVLGTVAQGLGRIAAPVAAGMTVMDAWGRIRGADGTTDLGTSKFNDRVTDDTTLGMSSKGMYNSMYGLSAIGAFGGPVGWAAMLAAQGIDHGTQEALAATTASQGQFFGEGGVVHRFASGQDKVRSGFLGRSAEYLSTIGAGLDKDSTTINLEALTSAAHAAERQVGEGFKFKYTDSARKFDELKLLRDNGLIGTDELNTRAQETAAGMLAPSDLSDDEYAAQESAKELKDAGSDPQKTMIHWQKQTYLLLNKAFGGRSGTAAVAGAR